MLLLGFSWLLEVITESGEAKAAYAVPLPVESRVDGSFSRRVSCNEDVQCSIACRYSNKHSKILESSFFIFKDTHNKKENVFHCKLLKNKRKKT